MRLQLRLLPVLGLAAVVLGFATVAQAASVGSPTLTIRMEVVGSAYAPAMYLPEGSEAPGYAGTKYIYTGSYADANLGCVDGQGAAVACYSLNLGSGAPLEVIVDPVISGPWALINPSASTQTYDITFTLSAAAFAGPTYIAGSAVATVADANASGGATLSTTGAAHPLYRALIDGSVVRTLLDDPSSAVVPPVPPAQSGVLGPAGYGLEVIGSGMSSDIGIRWRFSLSAGDSATVNGVFFAEPVPEPGTLGLAAVGIALLAAVRRRATR